MENNDEKNDATQSAKQIPNPGFKEAEGGRPVPRVTRETGYNSRRQPLGSSDTGSIGRGSQVGSEFDTSD